MVSTPSVGPGVNRCLLTPRTYAVTSILSLPTTLDRLAEMLKGAQGQGGRALFNVEDEVYVAAAMGSTMDVLRHPLEGLRPGLVLALR